MKKLIFGLLLAMTSMTFASTEVATIQVDRGFSEARIKSSVVGNISVRLDRFNRRTLVEFEGRRLNVRRTFKVEGGTFDEVFLYKEELIGNRTRHGYLASGTMLADHFDLREDTTSSDQYNGRGNVAGELVDFWVAEEHYHGSVYWAGGDASLTSFGSRNFFRINGTFKTKEALEAALVSMALRML